MTLNGISSTSGNSGVFKTDGVSVAKRLQEANKTVLDAKAKMTNENELQTVDISETENTAKTSGTAQNAADEIQNAVDSAEETYKKNIELYYEQIDTLRQQLKDIDEQRRALTRQLSQGGEISQLQSSFSQLNNQKNQIYDNINTIFINIMSIEDAIAENKAVANSAVNEINSLSASSSGMGNTVSTGGTVSTLSARSNSEKTGNAVIDFAEQFDDKNASQMSQIMRGNGSAYHENAWCADFVTFALKNAYGKDNVPGNFINTCSNTAYCPTIHSWAKSNGSFSTDANSAKPGDIVLFDWDGDGSADHVGLFKGINSNGTVATIEGNTSGAAGGSCVENKNRTRGTILGYVRLSALS